MTTGPSRAEMGDMRHAYRGFEEVNLADQPLS